MEPATTGTTKGSALNAIRKIMLTAGALGALALGGSAVAGAASSGGTTTGSTTAAAQSHPSFPAHGTTAHEGQEKAVTGTTATKAQDAAVKSVGSGKASAVTTDFTGNGYEVTVTKSDGSQVEVHLDSSFNVMQGHGG
jgi:nicotinic acid phosphoribosyltransferase